MEMPSGTGKTVSLLSLISSYQLVHKNIKLLYCSRTISEIEKVVEEAKRVLAYRNEELQKMGLEKPKTLCLSMSSRRNLCINSDVAEKTIKGDIKIQRGGVEVDSMCRDLTASWIRQDPETPKCDFFEVRNKHTTESLSLFSLKLSLCYPFFFLLSSFFVFLFFRVSKTKRHKDLLSLKENIHWKI